MCCGMGLRQSDFCVRGGQSVRGSGGRLLCSRAVEAAGGGGTYLGVFMCAFLHPAASIVLPLARFSLRSSPLRVHRLACAAATTMTTSQSSAALPAPTATLAWCVSCGPCRRTMHDLLSHVFVKVQTDRPTPPERPFPWLLFPSFFAAACGGTSLPSPLARRRVRCAENPATICLGPASRSHLLAFVFFCAHCFARPFEHSTRAPAPAERRAALLRVPNRNSAPFGTRTTD